MEQLARQLTQYEDPQVVERMTELILKYTSRFDLLRELFPAGEQITHARVDEVEAFMATFAAVGPTTQA